METDRRNFLTGAGTAAVVTLAGCTGGSGGSGTTESGGGTTGSGSSGAPNGTTTNASESGSGSGQLKLGVLVPFSGDYAWVGENVYPVAEMVVKEINKQGGINGKNVGLAKGDTEGAPDASLTAAKKLINVENVNGIIGPTSITMSAVFDLFTSNKLPVITPTAGTTSLDTKGGEYVFRTVPSDALGGQAIAKAARSKKLNSKKSYTKMALMIGNKEVFQSFKKPIRSTFKELGGTITTALDIKTGKASYQSEVQTVMNSNPGITTLIASKDDSVKVMQAAFKAGYEGNWFVTQDQTTQEFLKATSSKVTNGILGLKSAPFQKAKEAGRIEAFQKRVKEYSGDSTGQFSKNTYDAVNVFGLAMKAAATNGNDPTRGNIASNIRTVSSPPQKVVTNYTAGAKAISGGTDVNYQGLVGPINFDDTGDITAPFYIMQADGNSWNEIATLGAKDLT